jgi:hypothetical protein
MEVMAELVPPPPLERPDDLPEVFQHGRYLLRRSQLSLDWTVTTSDPKQPLLRGWLVSFSASEHYVLATHDRKQELVRTAISTRTDIPTRLDVFNQHDAIIGGIRRPWFRRSREVICEIVDPADAPIATVSDVDPTLAWMRHLLGNWVPQHFSYRGIDNLELAHCARTNLGFDLNLGESWHGLVLDPRLVLIAMLMIVEEHR